MAQFAFGYEELTRSNPTTENYNFQTGAITANRVFEGPWANRQRFIFGSILKPMRIVAGTTLLPTPQRYPDANIAFAKSVDVVGKGKSSIGPNGMAAWERAELTVDYGTSAANFAPSVQASTDNETYTNAIYMEEAIDSSIEALPLTGSAVKKSSDDVKLGGVDKITKFIIFADLVLTQTQLIKPRWGAIGNIVGKVNNNAFVTPSGFAVEAGKLLYAGPFGNTKVNIKDGSGELKDRAFPLPVWSLSHRFKFNSIGWNKKFDKDGAIVAVKLVSDKDLYTKADFYSIFGGTFDSSQLSDLDSNINTFNIGLELGFEFGSPEINGAIQGINDSLTALGFRI